MVGGKLSKSGGRRKDPFAVLEGEQELKLSEDAPKLDEEISSYKWERTISEAYITTESFEEYARSGGFPVEEDW